MRNPTMIALLLSLAVFHAPAYAADGVDATTSASVDAETGASKQVEEIAVGGDFAVAYAVNYDGALFVMAANLADAYHRDELASDSIFKDKDMVVKGAVEKTSKPGAAKPWVTLIGDEASGKKVRCSLVPGALDGRELEPGQVIQVRGICDGMKLSVAVKEAKIVD